MDLAGCWQEVPPFPLFSWACITANDWQQFSEVSETMCWCSSFWQLTIAWWLICPSVLQRGPTILKFYYLGLCVHCLLEIERPRKKISITANFDVCSIENINFGWYFKFILSCHFSRVNPLNVSEIWTVTTCDISVLQALPLVVVLILPFSYISRHPINCLSNKKKDLETGCY